MTSLHAACASWLASTLLVATPAPATAEPPASDGSAASIDPAAAAAWLEKALGLRLKPTGFLAVTTAFNTGAVFPTAEAPFLARQGARLVLPSRNGPTPWDSNGSLVITPRQSRFGFEIGLQLASFLRGTIVTEMDLWGVHVPAALPGITSSALRLRLAYLELSSNFVRFIAGQTLTIIAPRYPASANHLAVSAFTQAGFLWNRLPQLTVIGQLPIPFIPAQLGAPKLVAALSVVRPFSADHDATAATHFDQLDPGAASLLPFMQARAALDSKFVSVGVVGHAGVENFALTNAAGATTGHKQVPTYMVGGDAKVGALGFSLTAHTFIGANLNALSAMSGVRRYALTHDATGQPIAGTLRDVEALRGFGGFVQVVGPVWPGVAEWIAGAGAEQSLDGEKVAINERVMNAALQLGLMFPVHKNFDAGVELYHSLSRYKTASGNSNSHNDNLGFTVRMKL